jgi:hypothetical protein
MATAFSVFLDPLNSRLAGITPAQAQAELRAAAKEFYLQSRSWNKTIGPHSTTDGATQIALVTGDANAQVAWVREVWLQYGDFEEYLLPMVRKNTNARDDHPTHFFRDTGAPGTIDLWPTPDASEADVLWANVALMPTAAATNLPDLAGSHHFDAILDGAMARFLMMPNRPWSDPQMGIRLGQKFRRAIVEFRAVADAGYTRSDPGWWFPPFA